MKHTVLFSAALFYYSAALAQPCTQKVFASYSPGTVCATKPLNLYANTLAGASYSWTGPASYTSTVQNPVRNPALINMSGNYIVTATVGSCVYKDTVSVQINPTPLPPIITPIPPLCNGGVLNFNVSGTTGTTYILWAPNGSPAVYPLFNITPANNGIYKGIGVSTAGCVSDTGYANVQVTLVPKPTLASNSPLCHDDTLILSINANTSFVDNQYWETPSGSFVLSPVPQLIFPFANTTGYYSVANIYNSCYSAPDSVFVLFTPVVLPDVHITSKGTIFPGYSTMTFKAVVTNGGQKPLYLWFKNGDALFNKTTDTYTGVLGKDLFNGDEIYVAVQRDSVCSGIANSDTVTLNINLDVENAKEQRNITLYPNPNDGDFTISGIVSGNKARMDIINTIGQVVYAEEMQLAGNKLHAKLHLQNQLPAGMYQLKITSERQTSNTSFIISK